MDRIINMQFPFDQNNEIFDGKTHQIKPLSIQKLPGITESDNEYFILYYIDLSLPGQPECQTILLKDKYSIRKVPLSDYENWYNMLEQVPHQTMNYDVDRVLENCESITYTEIANTKDIIKELRESHNQKKEQNNNYILRVYIDDADHKYISESAALSLGIAHNSYNFVYSVSNKKINYLPGINEIGFYYMDSIIPTENITIEWVKVNNIPIYYYKNEQYMKKDDCEKYLSILPQESMTISSDIFDETEKLPSTLFKISQDNINSLNAYYSLQPINLNIYEKIDSNIDNQLNEESYRKIVIYSNINLENSFLDIETYNHFFADPPAIIFNYLPNVGNGSFVKLSDNQLLFIKNNYDKYIEKNIVNRLRLFVKEKEYEVDENSDTFDCFLTPEEYFKMFNKELDANKYITFNKREYSGIPSDNFSLYKLSEDESKFLYRNYLIQTQSINKRIINDEYTK